MIFASVADGLGSSKHSDIASKIASQEAVIYCANHIHPGMADEQILGVIHAAFDTVNFMIKQRAGDNLDDYDTTLTLAVFIKGNVYYGHAGDSGIIALRTDGIFEEVTEAQLGSGYGKERPVYPLASEANWVFNKYPHRTKALFLMTDGMLNKVVPPLLEGQEHQLDHAYLFYLYQNLIKSAELGPWIANELSQINPKEINYDDKTLVAIACSAVKLKFQPKKYYEYPSNELWSNLLAAQKKKLYPYKEETGAPRPDDFVRQVPLPLSMSPEAKLLDAWHIVFLAIGLVIGIGVTLLISFILNRDDYPQYDYPCEACYVCEDCLAALPPGANGPDDIRGRPDEWPRLHSPDNNTPHPPTGPALETSEAP